MGHRNSRPRSHVDSDGVKTIDGAGVRTSVWLLGFALVLVGLAVLVVIRPLVGRVSVPAEVTSAALAPHPAVPHPNAAEKAPASAVPGAVEPRSPSVVGSAAAPLLPHAVPRPVVSSAAAGEAPGEATEAAAEPATGIAAFPPQGTKPIMRGIIVPEDVELPPGYVRHYQATYEGRLLPPILMFHPDYQPVDAHGDPIALPEDRVVPADMAPAGMPVEMLAVPEDGSPMPGVSARGQNQAER